MSNFDESKVNREHGKFAAKNTSESDVSMSSGSPGSIAHQWHVSAGGTAINPEMNSAGIAQDFNAYAEDREKVTPSYTMPEIGGGSGARLTKKTIVENNQAAPIASGMKPVPQYDQDEDGIAVYQTKEGGYVAVKPSEPESLGGKAPERAAAETARVKADMDAAMKTYSHTAQGAYARAKDPNRPPMPAMAMPNPTGGKVQIGSKTYDEDDHVIQGWKRDSKAESGYAPTYEFVDKKQYAALFTD